MRHVGTGAGGETTVVATGGSSSGSGATGGASTSGGTDAVGGSATAGENDATGGSNTGGCARAECSSEAGAGSSEGVTCPTLDCPAGQRLMVDSSQCCPACGPDNGCASVTCLSNGACPSGTHHEIFPGTCCPACLPDDPPDCSSVVTCSNPSICPPGYSLGTNKKELCCPECLPDPGYCELDSDCVIALDTTKCGCPEAISQRLYDDDTCYDVPGGSRPACYLGPCGGALCASGLTAACVKHECTAEHPAN